MNRLILNGKSADRPEVRAAVKKIRKSGYELQVRTTWEQGDAALFAKEAAEQGVDRIIAGGGDGTLHEVMNGLMKLGCESRPEMAILPLGTANDFARSCGIPLEPYPSLLLAVQGKATGIDVGKMNDLYFLNMITAGFGAEVTVATDPGLKKMLGGAAYTLMGFLKAFNFKPYEGIVQLPGLSQPVSAVVGAIGNGRQAGGGKELTSKAYLNDGLLDVMIIREFTPADISQVIEEINILSESGQFISYYKTRWVEFKHNNPIPVNLDGEPQKVIKSRVEVIPEALKMILPNNCLLLS
ncbi:MAG: lipid kinase YegS [Gammaproteobacteria bacterium]|nr:lipid kinase YegS [Gammaproteobacteria bacterium]